MFENHDEVTAWKNADQQKTRKTAQQNNIEKNRLENHGVNSYLVPPAIDGTSRTSSPSWKA